MRRDARGQKGGDGEGRKGGRDEMVRLQNHHRHRERESERELVLRFQNGFQKSNHQNKKNKKNNNNT